MRKQWHGRISFFLWPLVEASPRDTLHHPPIGSLAAPDKHHLSIFRAPSLLGVTRDFKWRCIDCNVAASLTCQFWFQAENLPIVVSSWSMGASLIWSWWKKYRSFSKSSKKCVWSCVDTHQCVFSVSPSDVVLSKTQRVSVHWQKTRENIRVWAP